METRYTVRQAVQMTGVKSYVLRYWEEELELQIHRNELGHRYYTGYDIQLFMNIKELKKRGLQLRAIKNLIPQITASMTGFGESASTLLEGEVIDHAEVKTDRDLKEKISQKEDTRSSAKDFRRKPAQVLSHGHSRIGHIDPVQISDDGNQEYRQDHMKLPFPVQSPQIDFFVFFHSPIS